MYYYLSKILAPLLSISNFLFLLIIIFILLNLKYKKKVFKLLLTNSILLIFFISFFPVGLFGLKILERDYYDQTLITKIDNIIVLGSSENFAATIKTNKTNLHNSSERLISTIKLSNDFPNAKIYFIGGDGQLIKSDSVDEVYVAKKFFTDINFNLTKVTFVGDTRNTIENIQAIKELNISNQSNILITSASHMKRVTLISEYFNVNFIPYAVDYRSISSRSFLNNLQKFDVTRNLSNFNKFINEIIGVIAFKLFY